MLSLNMIFIACQVGSFALLLCSSLSSAFSPPLSIPRVRAGTEGILMRMNQDGVGDIIVTDDKERTRIVFPGGGIFFYWQAGAVSHLRERGYDLSETALSGASAGALAATLTATNVDFSDATRLALELAEKAGVWDRPQGLQGVWGEMIETWLDELLPENAVSMVESRLSLLVTPVPSFGKECVSSFINREDLIKCNMASVHLPWFLDGNLVSNFRNKPHIDGSFLSNENHYIPDKETMNENIITLDWTKDPIMKAKSSDFVSVTSKEGIWSMVDQGRSFAKQMERNGDFDNLSR